MNFINNNLVKPDSLFYITVYGLMIVFFVFYGDHVQPAAAGRRAFHKPSVIPASGQAAHRALPGPDPEPHHPARRPLPGVSIALVPNIILRFWDVEGFRLGVRPCSSRWVWRWRR